MPDFFFFNQWNVVNRRGTLLLGSTAVAVTDTAVTISLPPFRVSGRGTILVNIVQAIPEGTTTTLPIVFSANGSTQAVTKRGGVPLTVADLQGTGVYEFFYDRNAGTLQLLDSTPAAAAATTAATTQGN
jgi:hypothetical protein